MEQSGFLFSGLVVQSGDLSYNLACTVTIEGNSPVQRVLSPSDSLRAVNLGNSDPVKVGS